MTTPERPPRSAERAEGDPPEEQSGTSGRTPRPQEPAEGQDVLSPEDGADTPG